MDSYVGREERAPDEQGVSSGARQGVMSPAC